MENIGAYEAKTHLSELLDRVAKGERIAIKRHGVVVAVLQPADSRRTEDLRSVIEDLSKFRKGRKLGAPIREFIEEGRD